MTPFVMRAVSIIGLSALVLASSLIGIILVELLSRFLGVNPDYRVGLDRQIAFYDGHGSTFENKGDIFTYRRELRTFRASQLRERAP